MAYLQKLQDRYAQYVQEATQVRKKASPFAGIFGIGSSPKDHPCHETFYQDIQTLTEEFLASAPTAADAAEVVNYLLYTPEEHKKTSVYWFMMAAQGHAKQLIPLLSPEDCRPLLDWYLSTYPKRMRTPMHLELIRLLEQQSK